MAYIFFKLGANMISTFANAGVLGGVILLLALPALRKPAARGWVFLLVIAAAADFLLTDLGGHWQKFYPVFAASHWNWSGKIAGAAAMLAIAVVLIAFRYFKASDIGLNIRQAPGTGRVMLFAIAPFLIVSAVLMATIFGDSKPPTADTLAFQATMPGLAEELCYRGVLLALLDRMFAGRVRLLGAELGYGAVATSIAFGLLHGLIFDANLVLHTSLISGVSAGLFGFFLSWLRLRTKSLVLPVLVHNAANLIFVAVPRLI